MKRGSLLLFAIIHKYMLKRFHQPEDVGCFKLDGNVIHVIFQLLMKANRIQVILANSSQRRSDFKLTIYRRRYQILDNLTFVGKSV